MALGTALNIIRDINGYPAYGLYGTSVKKRAAIPSNTAQNFTVPAEMNAVLFSYNSGANVWVDFEATATLPSNGFSDTTAELNPIMRDCLPGQVISCISALNAEVGVLFFNRAT